MYEELHYVGINWQQTNFLTLTKNLGRRMDKRADFHNITSIPPPTKNEKLVEVGGGG